MFTIRIANQNDAKALAIFAEKTFRSTFDAENTPEDMNRHCANSYSESIQKSEILSEDWITFLLEDQNHLAGYAQLIKFRNKSCLSASQPMELHRFYIESNWQGQGAAQLLMDAVLLKVASLHCDCLWLGVWEKNPRAQSFYKKFGFEIAGSHVFTLGNDQQRDLIMARYFE